ncbi:TPA: hypothetical protein NKY54_004598 [Vibrio parahaemolyticus]|nr:hypothetical protein [Vibrio parahaemolyticus]
MNVRKDRKVLGLVFGALAIVANLMSVYGFFFNEIYIDFWSPRWFITVALMVVFAFAGGMLLQMSAWKSFEKIILSALAIFYTLCVVSTYLVLVYQTKEQTLDNLSFYGFCSLTCAFAFTTYLFYGKLPTIAHRILVVIVGIAVAVVFYWFMDKYVFNEFSFEPDTLIKEIGLLIVASVGFSLFFRDARVQSNKSSQKDASEASASA